MKLHKVPTCLLLMSCSVCQAETDSDLITKLLQRIDQLEQRVIELEQAQPRIAQPPGPITRKPLLETNHVIDSVELALHTDTDEAEQQQLVRAAFERTLIDRGGLLMPAWQFEVEPSLSYQNTSTDRILIDGFTILPVLVVGDIVSERVQREQITLNTAFRLGLPGDLQLDLSIPYLYEELQIVTAENEEDTRSDHGLGDISLGISWHALRARSGLPDLLASLTWKADSGRSPFDVGSNESVFGSGYHSLDTRLTAVKVVDPVVYFGGLNYTYNMDANEDIGNFAPGDSVGFNLGLAIALNLSSSISLSYDHLVTGHSRLDGRSLPGSDSATGMMTIGGSYAAEKYAFDFSLGMGVTSDAPDVLFRMALPLSPAWRK